jgi:hypothetical protein
MRAFSALFLSLLVGISTTMALAVYLPLEQVNKLFVTGLSAPIIVAALSVWSLRANSMKGPGLFFLLAGPLSVWSLYVGLVGGA